MPHTHPHAEATYRVVPYEGEFFAVEVIIPDSHPTRVSRFATEAEAEAWIVDHRRRVQAEGQAGRWFRKADGRRG